MSNESLMGSIAGAMAQAAHGAVLGNVIGRLKDQAADSEDTARGWAAYAGRLEKKVDSLLVNLKEATAENCQRIDKITELKIEVIELKKVQFVTNIHSESNMDGLVANAAYGRQIKRRLGQMEKALQHSSADKEALRCILKPYEDLVDRLNLKSELPDDLRQKAEGIWDSFMNGKDLTIDTSVQEIIDEAPVPKPTGGTTYR